MVYVYTVECMVVYKVYTVECMVVYKVYTVECMVVYVYTVECMVVYKVYTCTLKAFDVAASLSLIKIEKKAMISCTHCSLSTNISTINRPS